MSSINGSSGGSVIVSDCHLKLLLVGDTKVGKTSILSQYRDGVFNDKYTSTVGVDFVIKRVKDGGKAVRLEIWDSSGAEKYKTLTTSYYRDMSGMIIVFDVTDMETFRNVHNWLREIEKFAPSDVCKVLVGNKTDLSSERVVDKDTAQALADSLHIPYMETSAKDSSTVDKAFKSIVSHIKSIQAKNNHINEANNLADAEKKALRNRKLLFVKLPLMCLFAAASIYFISRNFSRLQRIFIFRT